MKTPMPPTDRTAILCLWVVLCLSLLVPIDTLAQVAVQIQAQIAVIAHKSVPLDEIRKGQLFDLYSRDINKWPDKEPVIVFDLKPTGEVKKLFYRFLGKSPSRMKSIWLKKMLAGESPPPQALASEEQILEQVAATAGSVGFINASKADARVKVLLLIDAED